MMEALVSSSPAVTKQRDESGRVAFVYVDILGVITADLERTRHDVSVATTWHDDKVCSFASRLPPLGLVS